MICLAGPNVILSDEQADAIGPLICCYGAAFDDGDPRSCTCWDPVYDTDQIQPPDPGDPDDVPPDPATRTSRCHDCAFRPESADRPEFPEQTDREHLLDVDPDRPFWCHQGMRRVVGWRHPDGHYAPNPQHHYDPPHRHRVPYRTDGTPADRCAGWARAVAEVTR